MANEPMSAAAMREVIERLAKLDAKATEGPWCWAQTGDKSNDYVVGTGCNEAGEDAVGRVDFDDVTDFIGESEILSYEGAIANCSDPALIVETRNALPALLHYALRGVEAEELEAGCEGCSLGGRDCEWVRLERGKACCEGCTHERRSR